VSPSDYHPVTYRLLCLKDGVVLKLRYADGVRDELVMADAEAQLLGTQILAAVSHRKHADGVLGAAEEAPAGPARPCEGFRWIGQSFAQCDRCGLPYWKHSHEERLREGAGPFGPDAMELVPISVAAAGACKRKWDGGA
jgi:hypothetical protein